MEDKAKGKEAKTLWPALPKAIRQEVGRRKEASARVRIYKLGKDGKNKQKDMVNGKAVSEWCDRKDLLERVMKPYSVSGLEGKFFFSAVVRGGGIMGQAEAVALGLARCLAKEGDEVRALLSKAGLMKRDPREVERKKIFHYKARRAPQWSKR